MQGRKLLMIPGSIEFEPSVMQAMGMRTTSHTGPEFIEVQGKAIERTRDAFLCPHGQPFILAGSGTLGMDSAVANLVEPGDAALVINTGFFGDRFGDILERYGAAVTHVRAPSIGDAPSLEDVEAKLKTGGYKLMTMTHVDTSSAVRLDVKALASIARKYGTLVVVDGVCSVAAEVLRMEEWDVDVVLTACQKAVGTPPGLALLVASPRAIEAFNNRKSPVSSYYADWGAWLPIMEAYEARRPSYFGTPAVNLVYALNESLRLILDEGMERRFDRHQRMADAVRAGVRAIGLKLITARVELEPNSLTAVYFPEGIDRTLLARVKETGVVLAGGLHPVIKSEYFRIGHMGAVGSNDVLATLGAIEIGLAQGGFSFDVGVGVKAAAKVLAE